MKVVLDSNIYKHDLTLERGKFQLLFSHASQGTFALVLPEVVAREATELYRREIDSRLDKLRGAANRLKALRVPVAEQGAIDVEAAASEFRNRLESKVLAGEGAELVELPEIPHDQLVDRAVRKRRPFGGKNAGYRDALIWHNVVALAASGETVALITDNSSDFATTDGTLHGDLRADLEAAGAKADSVLLYHDLDGFLKAQLPKEEEALSSAQEYLRKEDGWARLEDQLAVALSSLELPNEGRGLLAELDVQSESAWIETLDRLNSVEATNAYGLNEKSYSVELSAEVDVTIDFLAHKGDLYSTERMYELGDEVDPPFYIYDYDYNDAMAAAEAPLHLSVTVQATFNTESNSLEAVEVSDLSQT